MTKTQNQKKLRELRIEFQGKTGVKVYGEMYYNDFTLFIDNGCLNAIEMDSISEFLINKLSHTNDFSYLLPKVSIQDNRLAIRFSDRIINEII